MLKYVPRNIMLTVLVQFLKDFAWNAVFLGIVGGWLIIITI